MNHSSNISANKIWHASRLRQGSRSLCSEIWLRNASFLTRRKGVPDPYDALRREEQALHEQEARSRPSLQYFEETTSRLDVSTIVPTSDLPNFERAERPLAEISQPLLSTEVVEKEYDCFEPISESQRKVDPVDELVDDTRTLATFTELEEHENGEVSAPADSSELPAGNAELLSTIQTSIDIVSSEVDYVIALDTQFEEKYSVLYKSYRSRRDLNELRRRFVYEQKVAATTLKNSQATDLRALIDQWKMDASVFPIVSLLTGSLLNSAADTLTVLSALGEINRDFEVRAKCLHMACFLHRQELLQDQALMQQFDDEVNKLRAPENWPTAPLKLKYARLMLWRSDDAQLKGLVSAFQMKYHSPSVLQCLFFTTLCLSRSLVEEAVSIFKKLPRKALAEPDKNILRVCAKLIEHDTVVDTPMGPNFRFLPELLTKGLVPDSALHSCIIERALNLNYSGVAWDLFHHLGDTQHHIDSRTYLLLLHHSFLNKDERGVNEIMSEMHTKRALYTDPYLLSCAMNIIRCICFYYQKMDAPEALSHILALYDRAYTRAPLIRLGIVTHAGPRESAETLPEPSTYMLCFTVWSYILCHHHVPTALRVWERIHRRIQKGDKALVECMTMDFFYNAYILLYRRKLETLPHALEMLQYMLEKRWCLPSHRTWSILICGYLRHGQRAEAQQLLDLMLAHGFSINDVGERHLPRGWTLEDLEAMSDHFDEEYEMPDGSNPLQNRLVEDSHRTDAGKADLPGNPLSARVDSAKKDEIVADDFAASGPLSRLVVA